MEAAAADPAISADVAASPAPLEALAAPAPEPTSEELLAAHVRLAQALQATRDDPEVPEPLGLGTDVLQGLLTGLVRVEASPNFVTPGDLLLRAAKLRTIADVER